MQTSKTLLRKTILGYRQLLDRVEYEKRNALLIEQVRAFLNVQKFACIHVFLPIAKNNEPDITPLFPALYKAKKNIIVSKTNFRSHAMEHFYLERSTRLVKNRYGIPEPEEARHTTIDKIDIIMVPLLIADKYGHRIGYGGGYYDQFLSQTEATKVGLSLSFPVDKIIQKTSWDIPLDRVLYPFL